MPKNNEIRKSKGIGNSKKPEAEMTTTKEKNRRDDETRDNEGGDIEIVTLN